MVQHLVHHVVQPLPRSKPCHHRPEGPPLLAEPAQILCRERLRQQLAQRGVRRILGIDPHLCQRVRVLPGARGRIPDCRRLLAQVVETRLAVPQGELVQRVHNLGPCHPRALARPKQPLCPLVFLEPVFQRRQLCAYPCLRPGQAGLQCPESMLIVHLVSSSLQRRPALCL